MAENIFEMAFVVDFLSLLAIFGSQHTPQYALFLAYRGVWGVTRYSETIAIRVSKVLF